MLFCNAPQKKKLKQNVFIWVCAWTSASNDDDDDDDDNGSGWALNATKYAIFKNSKMTSKIEHDWRQRYVVYNSGSMKPSRRAAQNSNKINEARERQTERDRKRER